MLPILLTICSVSLQAQAQSELLVVATFVSGDVVFNHAGKQSKVKTNAVFGKDDEIITKSGKVDIQIGPNVIIRLSNFSSLKMKDLLDLGDSQKINVEVSSGNVYSKIVKKLNKNSEFNLQGQTTTAGVRGTEFLLSEDESEKNKGEDADVPNGVFVNEGSVEVGDAKSGKKQELNEGEEIVAKGGELKKQMLEEFIKKKMEIFKKLDVMKEENYKLLKEQREKNKALFDEMRNPK